MAKKRTTAALPASVSGDKGDETKLEAFADDLGRLLGEARNKADGWLAQRKVIAEHLTGVRDAATHLLTQLGVETGTGRSGAAKRRKPGRPARVAEQAGQEAPKRRTISAEGRRRIAAAQRARWAKLKAAKK